MRFCLEIMVQVFFEFSYQEISDPAKFRKSYFLFFFWSVASRARKKFF